MPNTKIVKVIAGPGGGKTTGLVKEVLSNLDKLKPNRYFVVITYTNAATNKIRSELERKIKLPPNIFIGTIHSFLNKFILLPHAAKIGIIPNDMIFIDDLDLDDPKARRVAIKNARDKGVITYEQIEWISEKIICGGKIQSASGGIVIKDKIASIHAKSISQRIQSIFVDEYQDATIPQHNIFTKLILTNLVDYFYCVGDPEQYIYGFTYNKKSVKKPEFNDIPIQKIDTLPGVEIKNINENYRSGAKIVEFINNFSKLKQKSALKESDGASVIFIKATNQDEIIKIFNSICIKYCSSDKKKFYLSHAGKTIESKGLIDIDQIVKPSLNSEKLLSGTMRLICGILGKGQKEICNLKNWTLIDLRLLAVKILKIIKSSQNISENDLKEILQKDFGLKAELSKSYKYNSNNILGEIVSVLKKVSSNSTDIKSTIHKSKGLEAEAVLAIAKTKNELIRWLEINSQKRSSDNTDVCRIGFVAFSRPKRLLCISCLDECSDIKDQILSLGVVIM